MLKKTLLTLSLIPLIYLSGCKNIKENTSLDSLKTAITQDLQSTVPPETNNTVTALFTNDTDNPLASLQFSAIANEGGTSKPIDTANLSGTCIAIQEANESLGVGKSCTLDAHYTTPAEDPSNNTVKVTFKADYEEGSSEVSSKQATVTSVAVVASCSKCFTSR